MTNAEALDILESYTAIQAVMFRKQGALDIGPAVSSLTKAQGRGRPADPTARLALGRIYTEEQLAQLISRKILIERSAERIPDDRQRRLILSVYFMGKSPEQTAEAMSITEGVYKRLLARALQSFAVEFEKLQPDI